MAKLSYRQLDKKRFDGWMLFYIQDPEDAKSLFTLNPDMRTKDQTFIKLAYDCASKLMEDFKANPRTAVSKWASYYKKEIKEALSGHKREIQPKLF